MTDLETEITAQFPKIKLAEPLRPYSTFKIGGPADYFYHLKDLQELPKLSKFAEGYEIPTIILGAGSNVLFDDKGFRGLVIRIEADKIEVHNDFFKAEAGALIPTLIKKSLEAKLEGLEKWIGLPGTVGGAVRGNAGCNGLETSQILEKAEILDPKTHKITERTPKDLNFSYRHSRLKETPLILLKAEAKVRG